MNYLTSKRIQIEVKKIQSSINEYKDMFTLNMIDNNVSNWQAIIIGPKGSLYENHEFLVNMVLPPDYPLKPIIVKFVTPIQHVNINECGDICLSILKDEWKSTLNIVSVLISIVSLLSEPNFEDGLNANLTKLYRENKESYTQTVLAHCEQHIQNLV
jgi:ubiquitin-protein ligase